MYNIYENRKYQKYCQIESEIHMEWNVYFHNRRPLTSIIHMQDIYIQLINTMELPKVISTTTRKRMEVCHHHQHLKDQTLNALYVLTKKNICILKITIFY